MLILLICLFSSVEVLNAKSVEFTHEMCFAIIAAISSCGYNMYGNRINYNNSKYVIFTSISSNWSSSEKI